MTKNNDNIIFRSQIIEGEQCWSAKDIGRFLGFGGSSTGGGNYSRLFNGAWKNDFVEGLDYHNIGKQKVVWVCWRGITKSFLLIEERLPQYQPKIPDFWKSFNGIRRAEPVIETAPIPKKRTKFQRLEQLASANKAEIQKLQRQVAALNSRLGMLDDEVSSQKTSKAIPYVGDGPPVKKKANSILYRGQRRGLKHKQFVIYKLDLEELQALTDEALRDRRPREMTPLSQAVREMLIDNRRWARKNGKTRVHNHLKAAVERGVATWRTTK